VALSAKQQAFIESYLRCWNGYRAAIDAGYSETSARHQASRLLSYDNIQAAIQGRLSSLKMSADEVLTRLTGHARGSLEDFLRIERVEYHPRQAIPAPTEADPEAVRWVEDPLPVWRLIVTLDLEQARDRGKLHLLKKMKWNQWGEPEIEIHDPQSALALLGKAHGLFVEKAERDDRVTIRVEYGADRSS
jgi:hypothetical protein